MHALKKKFFKWKDLKQIIYKIDEYVLPVELVLGFLHPIICIDLPQDDHCVEVASI